MLSEVVRHVEMVGTHCQLNASPKTAPIGRPYFHRQDRIRSHSAGGFTPKQIALHYNFPVNPNPGAGQNIALIELGGGINIPSLVPYWTQNGLLSPPSIAIYLPTGNNTPGGDADGEVCLDVCIPGVICSFAKISVIFAQNSDVDFYGAVTYAVDTVKATVISISWGGPENSWSAVSLKAFQAAIAYANSKGVQVCVAAGDNDSGDGEGGDNVDFPGSAPNAICCGGTLINGSVESVWNDGNNEGTGGGFSASWGPAAWQTPFNSTGKRSVPDVAGDADPESGWIVSVNGDIQTIGGTSAVAPMWAALIALMQQALGRPVTQAEIYAAAETFTDITVGNNGDYQAKVGFDQCTGLGVPNGAKLLAAIQNGAPGTPPVVTPPAAPPAPPSPTTGPTLAQVAAAYTPTMNQLVTALDTQFLVRGQVAADDAEHALAIINSRVAALFPGEKFECKRPYRIG